MRLGGVLRRALGRVVAGELLAAVVDRHGSGCRNPEGTHRPATMARTYKRDSRGRFASGGGGSARPKARSAPRGPNRLTRDNAGRITSVGGEGATARGGRLRTASGKLRATQTARIKGGGGMIKRGKKGSGSIKSVASNASPRQGLTMEQRKARLLQVHGRAMERDIMAKKNLSRRQIRDILDAGSPAAVVRNVKKWVGKNRQSMKPKPRSGQPLKTKRTLETGRDIQMKQVRKVQNQKLRDLNRRIKEGGPLARGLRLEKLKLQDAMQATRPRRR